jgi:polygalacturonase
MRANYKLIIAVLFFVGQRLSYGQSQEYLITSFGAVADGVTNNAQSIQKAIDQASNDGGGKVIIPPGNFASGVIFLKSNVDLHLQQGARLLGSVKRKDYDNRFVLALMAANDQKNISISGEGVIDGQAQELMKDIF